MLINIPYTNHFRAFISGFILLSILFTGELIGGTLRIVLGIFSVFWLIASKIIFVSGRGATDWLKGKRSYWDVNKPILFRLLSYFLGMIVAAAFFKIVA
jgi:hypothetical protein